MEAVDRAIGQLARLLWQTQSTGKFKYFLCVTGDHSTPVEYGDHSFEPVPFALCRLEDFVDALGESVLSETSLDPFPLPTINGAEDIMDDLGMQESSNSKQFKASAGDSVWEFNEVAAARGCLGRFPGSEMMGIIKAYLRLNL